MKKCCKCGVIKNIKDFNKNKTRPDGLQSYCIECQKLYRKNHSVEFIKYNKKYLEKPDKLKNRKRYVREWGRTRKKEIYHSNPEIKIRHNLRVRLNKFIRREDRSGSIKDLIGCTMKELKNYLENQFDKNMTWDNYGSYWHIDHIKPCSKFNLLDIEEQKKCFHYTNLQPLEASRNISKSNKDWTY